MLWWGEKRLAVGDNKGLIRGLWVTILMGGTFLIVQLNEYAHLGFTPQDRAFSGAFYTLTGFHGVHVTVGVIMLLATVGMVRRNRIPGQKSEVVELVGLYWHFVDVVWIIIFTLVYLIPS